MGMPMVHILYILLYFLSNEKSIIPSFPLIFHEQKTEQSLGIFSKKSTTELLTNIS